MLAVLVRLVNTLIAIALFAILTAVYWFAWRPLPATSGSLEAPVTAAGEVSRNGVGAILVKAASSEDAYFLQGYATAQDRLWQMDAMRRMGAGELAEVAGSAAVDSDREARQWRLASLAESWEDRLTPQERLALTAYARGVNHFIETHRSSLPLEFTLMRYEPRPWRIADSLLAGVLMYKTLTLRWRTDWEKQEFLSSGDPAKVDQLYPAASQPGELPGSNAWVLAGSRTESGKPILANDMHLGWAVPDTWHMIQLETPDFHIAGLTLPGLPGIVVGHNGHIGWGVTNLGFDVQDLYFEELDPVRGIYRFGEGLEQAAAERSYIRVNEANPIEVSLWITRHGPAFLLYQGRYVALKWAAYEFNSEALPYLRLNTARTWPEFRAALSDWSGPGLNFVYADKDGNIGFQVAGRLPIRRGFAGDALLEGSTGRQEWEGFIPFDQLPSAFNPAQGYIVTSNQNPFPADYPYTVTGTFEPGFRSDRIRQLITQKEKWSVPQQLGIQRDIYSSFHHTLARRISEAAARKNISAPGPSRAIELLQEWDGRMEAARPQPMIAELTFQHFRTALGNAAAPGKGPAYQWRAVSNGVVDSLLRTRPDGWFEDWDQALLDAFDSALGEGVRMQGPDPAKWRWGQLNEIRLAHPVGTKVPLLNRRYDFEAAPLDGCQVCVNQASTALGPSQRMIIDFSDFDSSLLNIRLGQSAHPLSFHYKDQWQAFREGRSFPFRFNAFDAQSTLRLEPAR